MKRKIDTPTVDATEDPEDLEIQRLEKLLGLNKDGENYVWLL